MMSIEETYRRLSRTRSDIFEHLPTLKKYASECDHVTEMGVRGVVSTWALLAGNPKKMISYDIRYHPNIENVKKAAVSWTLFQFKQENVLTADIEETDLLFIDTWHTYNQMKAELDRHADKVRKYIIMHDTTTFAEIGEDKGRGMWDAIAEFLSENPCWKIKERFPNNNGLTVLQRLS